MIVGLEAPVEDATECQQSDPDMLHVEGAISSCYIHFWKMNDMYPLSLEEYNLEMPYELSPLETKILTCFTPMFVNEVNEKQILYSLKT